MMIVDMQIQTGTSQDLRKAPDAAGLLTIDDNQTGDSLKIDILGAG